MLLRPYQSPVVARACELLREGKRVVVVLPTGAGKTVVAAEIVRRFPGRTLWLAHRRELLAQARAALPPGVLVDAVQRRRAFPPHDLLVVDEGHHSLAPTYLRHLAAHRGAALHLTATPYRLDGRGLGDVADVALWVDWPDDSPPVVREGRKGTLTLTAALVREGSLVEPRYFALPGVDTSKVKKRAGDFRLDEIAAAADKPKIAGDAVREYLSRAKGRRALAFCVTVEHAKHVCEAFTAAGVRAAVVVGETDPRLRDQHLRDLRDGDLHVVCTVAVLTEGFDLPALEVGIMLRPTTSLCLWLQMLGRFMRPCDGKDGALIFDHAGNTARLGYASDDVPFDFDGRAAGEKPVVATTTCLKCYAIFRRGPPACPVCGETMKVEADPADLRAGIEGPEALVEVGDAAPRKPLYVYDPAFWNQLRDSMPFRAARGHYQAHRGGWPILNGRLELLDPTTEAARKWEYLALLLKARELGKKPSWAAFVFRSKFGSSPPREWLDKAEAKIAAAASEAVPQEAFA